MLPAFYHILPSTKLALTEDANVESAAIAHGGEFILTSENGYHLAIGPTAEATDDDLYIPANTVFPIVLDKGEKVSLFSAADGSAWLTPVRRT